MYVQHHHQNVYTPAYIKQIKLTKNHSTDYVRFFDPDDPLPPVYTLNCCGPSSEII